MVRRLIEAGSRVVQVNWPAVANGNPTVDAWDTHADNFGPLKNLHCPKLDSGLPTLIEDLDQRGLLKDTIVLAIGEFGRSPKMGVSTSGNTNSAKGRDHWPYCYTGLMAGGGIQRGAVYGKSDKTGSSPAENPVHPIELLATVYHAMGIDPSTLVMNHLGQPPTGSGQTSNGAVWIMGSGFHMANLVETPESDHDGGWKESVVTYLERFFALCCADVHGDIDWSRGFEFLDKEFQRLIPEANAASWPTIGRPARQGLAAKWRRAMGLDSH